MSFSVRPSFFASVVALAVLVGACSSDKPKPPLNAGTLVVHAEFEAGPVMPNGHLAVEAPLPNNKVRVRATDGTTAVATTDRHGSATLVLAPGAYTATLDEDCPTGVYPQQVRVPARGKARVTVACPGQG
jgi:hypothetical protein